MKLLVPVSYTESVLKLYTNLAEQLMRDTKILDVLSQPPSINCSGVDHLPSWVPDGSVCTSMNASHTWSHGPMSLSGADTPSRTSRPPFDTMTGTGYTFALHDSKTLILSGYRFDTITGTGHSFQGLSLPRTVSTVRGVARDWMKTK